jgi:hypothetical protein
LVGILQEAAANGLAQRARRSTRVSEPIQKPVTSVSMTKLLGS